VLGIILQFPVVTLDVVWVVNVFVVGGLVEIVFKGEVVEGFEPVELDAWLMHCPELLVNAG
jgi:hypothetical protein